MPCKILVIDDSEIALELAKAHLGDAGYEAVCVNLMSGGMAAAASLAEQLARGGTAPDLIIVDLTMPGVSGAEIVRLLKDAWGIHVPIYLWSAHLEENLRESAKAASADGFICKNWGFERLVAEVKRALTERDK